MDAFRSVAVILTLALMSVSVTGADLEKAAPLTDAEWEKVRQHVDLLDKISFVPSLLPVIMKHRDALELSDSQKAAFREWRKQNYRHMVDVMNAIIERRITLSRGALDSGVNNEDLQGQQQAILELQQELLQFHHNWIQCLIQSFRVLKCFIQGYLVGLTKNSPFRDYGVDKASRGYVKCGMEDINSKGCHSPLPNDRNLIRIPILNGNISAAFKVQIN